MNQWDYLVAALDEYHNPGHVMKQEWLREKGQEGWELVSVTMNTDGKLVAFLKRPFWSPHSPQKASP